jgi:hypothetical protein
MHNLKPGTLVKVYDEGDCRGWLAEVISPEAFNEASGTVINPGDWTKYAPCRWIEADGIEDHHPIGSFPIDEILETQIGCPGCDKPFFPEEDYLCKECRG